MKGLSDSDSKLLVEIAVILVIKVSLLFVIWHAFFSDKPAEVSAESIANTLIISEQGEPH
jgi:hypothetical protein